MGGDEVMTERGWRGRPSSRLGRELPRRRCCVQAAAAAADHARCASCLKGGPNTLSVPRQFCLPLCGEVCALWVGAPSARGGGVLHRGEGALLLVLLLLSSWHTMCGGCS